MADEEEFAMIKAKQALTVGINKTVLVNIPTFEMYL